MNNTKLSYEEFMEFCNINEIEYSTKHIKIDKPISLKKFSQILRILSKMGFTALEHCYDGSVLEISKRELD